MKFHFSLPAKKKYLQLIRFYIYDICTKLQITPCDITDIKNIVGEAASNIVKYAYKNKRKYEEKTMELDITYKKEKNQIIIDIIDHGKGFDPSFLNNLNKKEIENKIKKMNKGGYGLYLIKKCSDKVEFDIKPFDKNVIRVTKNLQDIK